MKLKLIILVGLLLIPIKVYSSPIAIAGASAAMSSNNQRKAEERRHQQSIANLFVNVKNVSYISTKDLQVYDNEYDSNYLNTNLIISFKQKSEDTCNKNERNILGSCKVTRRVNYCEIRVLNLYNEVSYDYMKSSLTCEEVKNKLNYLSENK